MDLALNVQTIGGWRILAVSGELDVYTVPERLVTFVQEGTYHVIIDLNDVGFMDSTALGVLVGEAALRPWRRTPPRLRPRMVPQTLHHHRAAESLHHLQRCHLSSDRTFAQAGRR
jgi:hypothetical protein